MPQCLVIASSSADLSALQTVLAELDITATTTTQLLAGAQLATVPLDDYSFAVAVLPASVSTGIPAETPATIYLESGIALGRGMPLIVLAENPDDDLPALGGLASSVWMIGGAKDAASIRLHLTLFTKVLEITEPALNPVPRLTSPVDSQWRSTGEGAGRPGRNLQEVSHGLEQEVLTVLRAGGAEVEAQAVSSGGDRVDAAAFIPGTEQILGPILIEVTALREQHGLSAAVDQLTAFLVRSRATLGLVIYNGPYHEPLPATSFPVVVTMHIDDLREHVRQGSLGSTLIYARNAAVHADLRHDA